MFSVTLPISKSIANRLLIRQAYQGQSLLTVDPSCDPDDVVLLHRALTSSETMLDLGNCGTAVRFLTAYFAQLDGCHKVLDGCERMRERPIGPLVDALRSLGADIAYLGCEGFLPLEIHGRLLARTEVRLDDPLSTQFVSALILIDVPVLTNSQSPYLDLTRGVIDGTVTMERDWSAAAFWLERWALGLCERPAFPGLRDDSLQGDKVCVQIFEQIRSMEQRDTLSWDFANCPDLYPAVAIACEQKGIRLVATGTDSLRLKESDRLRAVAEHRTYHDHRIAMALLAANLPCDDTACIAKSYPQFVATLVACSSTQGACSSEACSSCVATCCTPIGVTGGIGSGKSTICRALAERGYAIYDCDSRAKQLIVSDPAIRREIIALLGSECYEGDTYRSDIVASKVFADASLLAALNAIVHPAVHRDIVRWCEETMAAQPDTLCFVESAILYESGIDALCRAVVYVDAPVQVRIARTLAREQALGRPTTEEAIRARIAAQKTSDARLASDITLLNDGLTPIDVLLDGLEGHIQSLHAVR